MNHWVITPIMLPLATAVLLVLLHGHFRLKRAISGLSALALLAVGVRLVLLADQGEVIAYQVGAWPAPFGISVVLDRLSAQMVALTALLGTCAWLYASAGSDATSTRFHPLLHLLMMGVSGAFLTGDIFNLFVFFEVLLIASYGLMMHGGGAERVGASLQYVILNLAGSALFLIAVSLIYGVTGTLNMAHLAERVALVSAADAPILRAGGLLLLVVFGLKAALFPVSFWLPRTYAAADPAVASLFAIMTKVGVYAILRTTTLIFGPDAGEVASLAAPWLLIAGLVTLGLGTLGALGARTLGQWVGALLLASVGLMVSALASGSGPAVAAALYYLVHSTLLSAGLFLLIDRIAAARPAGGAIVGGSPLARPTLLGGLFLVAAIASVGLPPLSGFLGKAMVLAAIPPSGDGLWVWAFALLGGLFALVATSRVGSKVFWDVPEEDGARDLPLGPRRLGAIGALLGASVVLSFGAGPVLGYTDRVADQLLAPQQMVRAVLARPVEAR